MQIVPPKAGGCDAVDHYLNNADFRPAAGLRSHPHRFVKNSQATVGERNNEIRAVRHVVRFKEPLMLPAPEGEQERSAT